MLDLKLISTLRRRLESVDSITRDPQQAAYERSDVCAAPAARVIGEAMVSIVLAQAFLEKFDLKLISALRRRLESVDSNTRDPHQAAYERSDVCVAPAAGVIGEAMVSIVPQAVLEKFGGESMLETRRNYNGYIDQVRDF